MSKKKIKIDIMSIYGSVLFSYEAVDNTVKKTAERAVGNGANLNGANLNGASLNGANLNGVNLDGASLDRANLDGASLDRANLDGANLNGANLDGASLYRASLNGASLNGASLDRANLDGANLYRASLNGASLDGANLDGANLYRASLNGASLDGASLNGASLNGVNLDGASLDGANLNGVSLYRASLNGVNLDGASLDGANLNGVSLYRASLNGVKNLSPIYFSELYNLKLLPKDTKIRMWKYLQDGKSPYQYAVYNVDKTYKVKDFSIDEHEQCGIGLNVATLQWCLRDSLGKSDIELIEVEFKISDIVAIPYFTDGKFRVKTFKVLRKISREEGMDIMYKLSGFKRENK